MTWHAVLESGPRPVCVSAQKFYGTWGDPREVQDELRRRGDCRLRWQDVDGERLLPVGAAPPPAARVAAWKIPGRGPGYQG